MSVDQSPNFVLIDFASDGDHGDWMIINDGVMGGRSTSRMSESDSGSAVFSGEVSLANNGGFASTRSPISIPDMSEFTGVRLRVCGDGQRYRFRIRTDAEFDGVAYQLSFDTVKDAWIDVNLPFAQFAPSFRGRPVPEAGPLNPERIRQIGFLIADKQAGPFALKIKSIAFYR
ncbi:MAG: CIA30 family protein [candidate division Zixibacteria bacterium]|nr:CIA30 family protein [candidate division Zixibacteria bacterium]